MPSVTRGSKPFISIPPRSTAPVVLTCEHATNRLPFTTRPRPAEREVLEAHWGWDIGAWALTRELARRLRTGAIGGRWSRLVVDPNRRVDDPSLIPVRAGGVDLSWNARLSFAEVERRVLAYHTPYHVEVDRLILRRLVRGVRPLLLSVHTFTPVLHGRPRRFEAGVLYEEHGDLARTLGRALRSAGLSVRYNAPYSGMAGMMYSADRHGKHHGLPCLELEINQGLFRRRSAASSLGGLVTDGIREVLARLTA